MPDIDDLPPLHLAWPLAEALKWRCRRSSAVSVAEAYDELRRLCVKGRVQSWGVRKARPYALMAKRPARKPPDNLPERAEAIHDQLWLTYSELVVEGDGRPSGELEYNGIVEWNDVCFSQPQLVSEWGQDLRVRFGPAAYPGDAPLNQPHTAASAPTPQPTSSAADTVSAPATTAGTKKKRAIYYGDLAEFVLVRGVKLPTRLTPRQIAKLYLADHDKRARDGKSVPELPTESNRVTRIVVQVKKILDGIRQSDAPAAEKVK